MNTKWIKTEIRQTQTSQLSYNAQTYREKTVFIGNKEQALNLQKKKKKKERKDTQMKSQEPTIILIASINIIKYRQWKLRGKKGKNI